MSARRLSPALMIAGCTLAGCASDDAGPCGPWSSIDEPGTTWEYAFVNTPDVDGGYTSTALGEQPWEGEQAFAVETRGETFSPEHESDTYEEVRYHRCDEQGIWLLGSTYRRVIVIDGATTETSHRNVYTSPDLEHPLAPGVGDTWTAEVAYELTRDGEVTPYAHTVEREVVERRPVHVPAGRFGALAITSRRVQADYASTSWYTRDVGFVTTDGVELVAWE